MDQNDRNKIKLILADDQIFLLEGMVLFLEQSGYKVIAKISDPDHVVDACLAQKPDILVCDMWFSQDPSVTNGIQLVASLRNLMPDLGIVMYSQFEDLRTIAEIYKLGANAYLQKNFHPHEIDQAIEASIKGKRYYIPHIATQIVDYQLDQGFASDSGNPTVLFGDDPRLLEIFILSAKGMTRSEIAERLGVTSKTVGLKVKELHDALGVDSTNQMTMIAIKYGLISIDDGGAHSPSPLKR